MYNIFPHPPWCPYRQSNNRQFGETLTCANGFVYTVIPGDTMYRISRRFNISLDSLIAANPQIQDPAVIYPGTKICIPTEYHEPSIPEPPACSQGFLYTIQAGNTIYSLASRYNLAPQDIIRANPQLVNPNLLMPGQIICIPLPIPEPPACINGLLYTLERGDSLYRLANRYDLTVQDIMRANPQIVDQNQLFVGQQICIPLPIPVPNCVGGVLYMVQKGESLNYIANKFELTLDELLEANPQIVNPNLIFPGQEICLP